MQHTPPFQGHILFPLSKCSIMKSEEESYSLSVSSDKSIVGSNGVLHVG